MYIDHFSWINLCSPSLADDRCYLHVLLYAVAWLLSGVVNTLPLLQREQTSQDTITSIISFHGWVHGRTWDWPFLSWYRCWWCPAGRLCSCRSWGVQSVPSRSAPPCGSPSSAQTLGSRTATQPGRPRVKVCSAYMYCLIYVSLATNLE